MKNIFLSLMFVILCFTMGNAAEDSINTIFLGDWYLLSTSMNNGNIAKPLPTEKLLVTVSKKLINIENGPKLEVKEVKETKEANGIHYAVFFKNNTEIVWVITEIGYHKILVQTLNKKTGNEIYKSIFRVEYNADNVPENEVTLIPKMFWGTYHYDGDTVYTPSGKVESSIDGMADEPHAQTDYVWSSNSIDDKPIINISDSPKKSVTICKHKLKGEWYDIKYENGQGEIDEFSATIDSKGYLVEVRKLKDGWGRVDRHKKIN